MIDAKKVGTEVLDCDVFKGNYQDGFITLEFGRMSDDRVTINEVVKVTVKPALLQALLVQIVSIAYRHKEEHSEFAEIFEPKTKATKSKEEQTNG